MFSAIFKEPRRSIQLSMALARCPRRGAYATPWPIPLGQPNQPMPITGAQLTLAVCLVPRPGAAMASCSNQPIPLIITANRQTHHRNDF